MTIHTPAGTSPGPRHCFVHNQTADPHFASMCSDITVATPCRVSSSVIVDTDLFQQMTTAAEQRYDTANQAHLLVHSFYDDLRDCDKFWCEPFRLAAGLPPMTAARDIATEDITHDTVPPPASNSSQEPA